jgi:hypothetical protein
MFIILSTSDVIVCAFVDACNNHREKERGKRKKERKEEEENKSCILFKRAMTRTLTFLLRASRIPKTFGFDEKTKPSYKYKLEQVFSYSLFENFLLSFDFTFFLR